MQTLERSGYCRWCMQQGTPRVNPLTGITIVDVPHDPVCPVILYGRGPDGQPNFPGQDAR